MVEHWNSANTVIFYGKDSELTGADREHQEVSMLALHLLQSALIHVNTLLLQRVLGRCLGPCHQPQSSQGAACICPGRLTLRHCPELFKTNAAIAESLSVSESAVEKYANSVFSKLGLTEEPQVHRRVAAVLAFLREAH